MFTFKIVLVVCSYVCIICLDYAIVFYVDSKLYQSIPTNYEKSVSKLLEINIISDHGLELIYSAKNKTAAIIDVLIIGCSDKPILAFCDLIDLLIENPTLKCVVENLRHGKNLDTYICTYIYRQQLIMYINTNHCIELIR